MIKTAWKRYRALWIGAVIGAIGILGFLGGVFQSASDRATDRFFLERRVDPRIVVVAIDDASISRVGRWPWPRTVHADLIWKLSNAGVKAIGYDVNFPESSDAASDRTLADALRAAGDVILPVELSAKQTASGYVFTREGTVQSITTIQSSAHAAGFTNLPLDRDGIARRVPTLAQGADNSRVMPFAFEVARAAGLTTDLSAVRTDRLGNLVINVPGSPRKSFPVISAADILDGSANLASLRDKIVFVGATAHDLHDEQNVPTSNGEPMSGVEIHASILDTIAQHKWLVPVPSWMEALVLLIIGLFLGALVPRVRARISATVSLVVWIVLLLAAFIAFDFGYIADIVWPTIVFVFGYAALLVERWVETEQRRRELRSVLGRYVSGSVVDAVMRDPSKLTLGGDRRRMSVLFSDLRGFTTMSEGMSPEQLVEVLNTYLHEMTMIVFEEQGVLDKYIGDAVMAFWNAPLDQPDHATRAVRTAVRMRDKLTSMNTSGAFPNGLTLKVGVGVNTGDMVVGNIGGELRYDYTVIGDSVNLASRTEGLNKEYGTEIIITEATKLDIGYAFLLRKLDKVAVKGKKEPITIYEVMSMKDGAKATDKDLAERFEQALALYFEKRFADAKRMCEGILYTYTDAATKNLLARCVAYETAPPPPNWDGTWIMMKK